MYKNKNKSAARSLPTVHVIIADASATKLSFGRETGISAKFGSSTRFASQLEWSN